MLVGSVGGGEKLGRTLRIVTNRKKLNRPMYQGKNFCHPNSQCLFQVFYQIPILTRGGVQLFSIIILCNNTGTLLQLLGQSRLEQWALT